MEDKTEFLYDHYKETVSYLKTDLKLRDRLFLYIVLIMTILFFQFANPKDTTTMTNDVMKNKIGLSITIDHNLISIFIMFALLIIVIRYFQINMYIERQYKYIHIIETKLNELFNCQLITRESKSYLKSYPVLSDFIDKFYKIGFPILLFIAIVFKVVNQWNEMKKFSIVFSLIILPSILLVIVDILYVLFIFRENRILRILRVVFRRKKKLIIKAFAVLLIIVFLLLVR